MRETKLSFCLRVFCSLWAVACGCAVATQSPVCGVVLGFLGGFTLCTCAVDLARKRVDW